MIKPPFISRKCPLWDIDKIEAELKTKKLPDMLKLSECEMIGDVKKFIEKHLDYARQNNGNATFKSYYDRLVRVNKMLKETL